MKNDKVYDFWSIFLKILKRLLNWKTYKFKYY